MLWMPYLGMLIAGGKARRLCEKAWTQSRDFGDINSSLAEIKIGMTHMIDLPPLGARPCPLPCTQRSFRLDRCPGAVAAPVFINAVACPNCKWFVWNLAEYSSRWWKQRWACVWTRERHRISMVLGKFKPLFACNPACLWTGAVSHCAACGCICAMAYTLDRQCSQKHPADYWFCCRDGV